MEDRIEWVEIIEPKSNNFIYANLTTGQCLWKLPDGAKLKKADDNQWWELWDPQTSRFYYYNASTQKTIWLRPDDCDIIPLSKLQAVKQNTELAETALSHLNGLSPQNNSKSHHANNIMCIKDANRDSPQLPCPNNFLLKNYNGASLKKSDAATQTTKSALLTATIHSMTDKMVVQCRSVNKISCTGGNLDDRIIEPKISPDLNGEAKRDRGKIVHSRVSQLVRANTLADNEPLIFKKISLGGGVSLGLDRVTASGVTIYPFSTRSSSFQVTSSSPISAEKNLESLPVLDKILSIEKESLGPTSGASFKCNGATPRATINYHPNSRWNLNRNSDFVDKIRPGMINNHEPINDKSNDDFNSSNALSSKNPNLTAKITAKTQPAGEKHPSFVNVRTRITRHNNSNLDAECDDDTTKSLLNNDYKDDKHIATDNIMNQSIIKVEMDPSNSDKIGNIGVIDGKFSALKHSNKQSPNANEPDYSSRLHSDPKLIGGKYKASKILRSDSDAFHARSSYHSKIDALKKKPPIGSISNILNSSGMSKPISQTVDQSQSIATQANQSTHAHYHLDNCDKPKRVDIPRTKENGTNNRQLRKSGSFNSLFDPPHLLISSYAINDGTSPVMTTSILTSFESNTYLDQSKSEIEGKNNYIYGINDADVLKKTLTNTSLLQAMPSELRMLGSYRVINDKKLNLSGERGERNIDFDPEHPGGEEFKGRIKEGLRLYLHQSKPDQPAVLRFKLPSSHAMAPIKEMDYNLDIHRKDQAIASTPFPASLQDLNPSTESKDTIPKSLPAIINASPYVNRKRIIKSASIIPSKYLDSSFIASEPFLDPKTTAFETPEHKNSSHSKNNDCKKNVVETQFQTRECDIRNYKLNKENFMSKSKQFKFQSLNQHDNLSQLSNTEKIDKPLSKLNLKHSNTYLLDKTNPETSKHHTSHRANIPTPSDPQCDRFSVKDVDIELKKVSVASLKKEKRSDQQFYPNDTRLSAAHLPSAFIINPPTSLTPIGESKSQLQQMALSTSLNNGNDNSSTSSSNPSSISSSSKSDDSQTNSKTNSKTPSPCLSHPSTSFGDRIAFIDSEPVSTGDSNLFHFKIENERKSQVNELQSTNEESNPNRKEIPHHKLDQQYDKFDSAVENIKCLHGRRDRFLGPDPIENHSVVSLNKTNVGESVVFSCRPRYPKLGVAALLKYRHHRSNATYNLVQPPMNCGHNFYGSNLVNGAMRSPLITRDEAYHHIYDKVSTSSTARYYNNGNYFMTSNNESSFSSSDCGSQIDVDNYNRVNHINQYPPHQNSNDGSALYHHPSPDSQNYRNYYGHLESIPFGDEHPREKNKFTVTAKWNSTDALAVTVNQIEKTLPAKHRDQTILPIDDDAKRTKFECDNVKANRNLPLKLNSSHKLINDLNDPNNFDSIGRISRLLISPVNHNSSINDSQNWNYHRKNISQNNMVNNMHYNYPAASRPLSLLMSSLTHYATLNDVSDHRFARHNNHKTCPLNNSFGNNRNRNFSGQILMTPTSPLLTCSPNHLGEVSLPNHYNEVSLPSPSVLSTFSGTTADNYNQINLAKNVKSRNKYLVSGPVPEDHSFYRNNDRNINHLSFETANCQQLKASSNSCGSFNNVNHGDSAINYNSGNNDAYGPKFNINRHKRGLFRKKLSIANMLSWSKEAIQQPMIETDDKTIKKEAIEIFKKIQMYMGDKRCKKQSLNSLALDIVNKGLNCRLLPSPYLGMDTVADISRVSLPSPETHHQQNQNTFGYDDPNSTSSLNDQPIIDDAEYHVDSYPKKEGFVPDIGYDHEEWRRLNPDNYHIQRLPNNSGNSDSSNKVSNYPLLKNSPLKLPERYYPNSYPTLKLNLRDEILMQLCRQTTENPDPYSSLVKGWELMALCLTFFGPSPGFDSYLRNFCLQHSDPVFDPLALTRTPVSTFADHCLKLLERRCRERDKLESDGLEVRMTRPIAHSDPERINNISFEENNDFTRNFNANHSKFKNSRAFSNKESVLMAMKIASNQNKILTLDDIQKAKMSIFLPSMFGNTLEEILDLQVDKCPDLKLPWVQITLSTEILRLNGHQLEGIFRIPGDIDEVNSLKSKMDQWIVPPHVTDPHIHASLLKLWYRELYEPLIPAHFYQECIENNSDPQKAIEITQRLPRINKSVLAYLVKFLQIFASPANSLLNKMDSSNLATVMAPNLLKCPASQIHLIYQNARKEMSYVKCLIDHWNLPDTDFLQLDISQINGIHEDYLMGKGENGSGGNMGNCEDQFSETGNFVINGKNTGAPIDSRSLEYDHYF
ncbi:uncharacterized protein LOC135925021 isoform X2 [Gordionus sp. m RMFG-2023]|uniref:uncharacterized protein LOC135925021 isoform X2 n=1 Tax=Gordionus sp. m RMFG-2023 TaxID=3053472 RepID=UPI0031FCBB68